MNNKQTYTTYLTLFKQFGFYQIVDPNSSKILGFNVFKLISILLTVTTTLMTAIGMFGVINEIDIGFKDIQMLYLVACILVGNIKITSVLFNANRIFKLFDTAQTSFLLSKHSKHNVKNVKSKCFKKTFPWYFFLVLSSLVLCITTPVVLNLLGDKTQVITNARKPNFFNFKYPFTTKIYNSFYKEFYLIETIMIIYPVYCMIITDLFLLATLQLLSNYYEIVSSAFKNFEAVSETGELQFYKKTV